MNFGGETDDVIVRVFSLWRILYNIFANANFNGEDKLHTGNTTHCDRIASFCMNNLQYRCE